MSGSVHPSAATPGTAASPADAAPTAPVPEQPRPGGSAPRGSDFCRVAVAGPTSRADLAVPTGIPLARLMPALLHHAGADPGPDGGAHHEGWVLRTADGTRLDAARTLAEAHVREGDVLFLGQGTDDPLPPLYDDVVEVIQDGGPTRARGARRAAAAFAAVSVTAAVAALAAAPGRLPGFLGLAAALVGLGLAALLSRAFADAAAGTYASVLATALAAVGAVRLLGGGPGTEDGMGAAHLLLAAAVVAAAGAAGPVITGGGDGTFAAMVTGAALATTGGVTATLWDTSPEQAAAVAAPLALAVTTLWPALALRLAHIPGPQLASTAEELEELPEQLGHDALRLRVERARRLLTGLLAGSQLVVLGGLLVLFHSGQLWAWVLAGAVTLLVLLRARLFNEAAQSGSFLVAGMAALLGGGIQLAVDLSGQSLALLGVLLPVCLTASLAACVVGLFSGQRTLSPRLARLLDIVETTLLLSVVPLVLAVWGVYTALLELKA